MGGLKSRIWAAVLAAGIAGLVAVHATAAEPAARTALGSHLIGIDYAQVDAKTNRHVLFTQFDADRVRRDLTAIAKLGLDPVRLFVESEAYPTHPGKILASDKLPQNLRTLLDIAAGLKLRVILTFEHWVPAVYMNLDVKPPFNLNTDPRGVNAFLFDPQIIRAHADSIADLINVTAGLAGGRTATPFAIDLANELSFYVDHAPILQTAQQAAPGQAGATPKTDAVTHLVSDAVDRYVAAHREALREAGFPGLITLSTYAPGPYPGDSYATGGPGAAPRRPVPLRQLRQRSGTDFIAVNVYPDPRKADWSADALLANLDLFDPACRCSATPVLVTETGLLDPYFAGMGAPQEAQYFETSLRALCKRGVAGWLYWSWDTKGASLPFVDNSFIRPMITPPNSPVRC